VILARSSGALQSAVNRFIADASGSPRPFVWTNSADPVLAAAPAGDKRQKPSTMSGRRNMVFTPD
jgi:hypothetical protein